MRILFVTSWFEPDSGAASARFSQLAHRLAAGGHEVTVLAPMPHHPQGRIAPAWRGAWTRQEWRGLVRVVRVWLWATPSPRIRHRLISQLSYMAGALLRGALLARPDVVLIESQPVPTGLAGVLLARLLRAPCVLSVSDLWPDHLLSVGAVRETHPLYRLARRVVDGMYRRAAAIVTISPEWSRRIAGRIEPTPALHTLLFMVDMQRLGPDVVARDFHARHNLTGFQIVACIGTFATQYDYALLLAAAKRLEDRRNLRFLLIGDGSQRAILRELGPNLQHIPWLPSAEIPAAWAAADVSCFALRGHELYSGTLSARLYESLASGTPIAAAVEGEAARIIRESGAGFATRPGDADAFAAALTRLLDDAELRERCGRAGRAWAGANCDVEVISRRYEQILLAAAGVGEAT